MTTKRRPDFRLEAALADPGFTPRVRDVPSLLDLLSDPAHAKAAEDAAVRVGTAAALEASHRTEGASPQLRVRLTRVVGRVAAELTRSTGAAPPELTGFLLARLDDADARTRAAAARALGKMPKDGLEDALLEALARDTSSVARRSIVEALGKTGGKRAAVSLREAAGARDGAFERVRVKAARMAERTAQRTEPSRFRLEMAPPAPTRVRLSCRPGLETLLREELASALEPRIAREPGRIVVTLREPPARLLEARTMLSFAFPLPSERADTTDSAAVGDAVVRALTRGEAAALLTHFTEGPVRYRVAWAEGGKRRAVLWDIAEAVTRRRSDLVNDPTGATWQAIVHVREERVLVELGPRFDDPRFAYRKGDVPAASHPTLAAGLVRLADVRPDDIVWDPFVGSGTELCERHLAGPYRSLCGSDRDARALVIARANLAAAGARETALIQGDARELVPPERPTLVLTNPPMGRRVLRGADLGAFLDRFLGHVARTLSPGGRLVWISPMPERTKSATDRLGFRIERELDVDMGGFTARMQRLVLDVRPKVSVGREEQRPPRPATNRGAS